MIDPGSLGPSHGEPPALFPELSTAPPPPAPFPDWRLCPRPPPSGVSPVTRRVVPPGAGFPVNPPGWYAPGSPLCFAFGMGWRGWGTGAGRAQITADSATRFKRGVGGGRTAGVRCCFSNWKVARFPGRKSGNGGGGWGDGGERAPRLALACPGVAPGGVLPGPARVCTAPVACAPRVYLHARPDVGCPY